MGAKVPEWLVQLLKASLYADDAADEETIFEQSTPETESTESSDESPSTDFFEKIRIFYVAFSCIAVLSCW